MSKFYFRISEIISFNKNDGNFKLIKFILHVGSVVVKVGRTNFDFEGCAKYNPSYKHR